MTRIKATCIFCGDISLPTSAVTLHVWMERPEFNCYRLTCPTCGCSRQRSMDDATLKALTEAGCPIIRTTIPAEMNDPARAITVPLTWDEVLDTIADLRAEEAVCLSL